MNEFLTGEQIARLEALKLVAAHNHRCSADELLAAAEKVARFIIEGGKE